MDSYIARSFTVRIHPFQLDVLHVRDKRVITKPNLLRNNDARD